MMILGSGIMYTLVKKVQKTKFKGLKNVTERHNAQCVDHILENG